MHGNTQLACIAILMAVLAWHFRRSGLPVCSTPDQRNQTRFLAKIGHAGYPRPTPWIGDTCSKGIRRICAVPGSDNSREAGEPTEKGLVKGQRLLQSLFSRLVGLLRLSAACVLLLAAAPYLLSSRLGTAVAAAAASRTLPGDVSIQRISLGWTQPVAVHGLSVYEGEAGKSRQLISLQRFSSAEPLHEVVTGKGHLTLTLTNPTIDCSLADSGDNFRLVQYLAESRLLGLLTGRQSRAAAAVALLEPRSDPSRHAVGTAAAAAAAAELQSHPIDVSDAAAVSEGDAGTATTAGAAAGPQKARGLLRGRHTDAAVGSSSTSSAAAAAVPTPPAAPAAAGALPANFIQRLTQADASSQVSAELKLPLLSVYIPDGQLLLPKELGAAMGDHIHAVAAAGRSAVQDLADELEEDCSWLQRQHQPQEQPSESQLLQQQQQHEGQQENQKQQQDGSMAAAVHSSWLLPPPGITPKAWQRATPLLLQVSGERVSALVRGWHCGSFWRISQSSLLLEQPATAAWEFTPELAALTLSQFNPLLEEVAFIREGGRLMTSIAPEGGKIPAESGQLWVSPVKLVVGKGNLLSQIFRLLGMHGRFGSSGHHHQQPWLLGNSSGSATAAAAAKEQAAAAAEGGAAVQGVEVWSGPLRVAMEAPGRFRTDRVDMIVGSGRNTLHLALWGTVDTNTNSLTMTIGLPDTTLAKAGLKNLPPGYMLPVAVGGPLHRPQVEWNAAVRQLAVLSAMQLGREAWQHEAEKVAGALWGAATHNHEGAAAVSTGLAGLFGVANRALSKATSSFIGQVDERLQTVLCGVPPPAELPWETARPTDTEQSHSHSHSHSHQQPHKPSGS